MFTKILRSRLKEFKSSGKDEKAFANYLQQSVACVIASVVKNGDLTSLEPHVQQLNEALDEIQEDIVKRQSQPPTHRFRRFINNRQQLQEDKARLDRALVVFNLGATVAAHEELFNISRDTASITYTLQNLRADVGTVKEDVAQTRVIATNVQHDIVHMDNHLEKVASGVDALHTDVKELGRDLSQVVSIFTGIDLTCSSRTPSAAANGSFFFLTIQ